MSPSRDKPIYENIYEFSENDSSLYENDDRHKGQPLPKLVPPVAKTGSEYIVQRDVDKQIKREKNDISDETNETIVSRVKNSTRSLNSECDLSSFICAYPDLSSYLLQEKTTTCSKTTWLFGCKYLR